MLLFHMNKVLMHTSVKDVPWIVFVTLSKPLFQNKKSMLSWVSPWDESDGASSVIKALETVKLCTFSEPTNGII